MYIYIYIIYIYICRERGNIYIYICMYVHTVYTCVYVTSLYDIIRTNSNIDYGDIYSEILVYTQLSIVSCTFQICFISI